MVSLGFFFFMKRSYRDISNYQTGFLLYLMSHSLTFQFPPGPTVRKSDHALNRSDYIGYNVIFL